MMNYKKIPMENFPRKNHFEYFKNLDSPYAGVTVNVDITEWLKEIKKNERPFFHSLLYAATKAANSVPQFRQRIMSGELVEFESCRPSYTVALPDETYCYCRLEFDKPLEEFLPYARAEQNKAIENPNIDEDENEIADNYFFTSLPWISFTDLVHPLPKPADSIPRIAFGKYFMQEGRTLIPVSVLCHHALVDGIHMAKFYKALEEELLQMTEYLRG